MTDSSQRLHATVHGHVQSVSFRYYTTRTATELGVHGWVRNLPDGKTVEIVAEGTKAQLESLLAFLHNGSPSAQVETVHAEWLPATGEFLTFKVRYTVG